jgi:hypothetical protein
MVLILKDDGDYMLRLIVIRASGGKHIARSGYGHEQETEKRRLQLV